MNDRDRWPELGGEPAESGEVLSPLCGNPVEVEGEGVYRAVRTVAQVDEEGALVDVPDAPREPTGEYMHAACVAREGPLEAPAGN